MEGELRSHQLVDYLERTNSQKSVFLSEDGSGIIKKIVFDPHSNLLIGLVLPINAKSGMPITFSYKAESAEMIKKHIEQPQSSLVCIVAAQPLQKDVAPFILMIYGTDNKFKSIDVLKRWMTTIDELKKYINSH